MDRDISTKFGMHLYIGVPEVSTARSWFEVFYQIWWLERYWFNESMFSDRYDLSNVVQCSVMWGCVSRPLRSKPLSQPIRFIGPIRGQLSG